MISNVIQMLDIPHFLWKTTFSIINWMREVPYEDDWGFLLGYYQALMYTLSFMSLLFSISLPMVSILAFIFFSIRYYIEKYNFLFVYEKEYESKGLFNYITNLQVMSAIFFQMLNFSYLQTLEATLEGKENDQ